MVCPALWFCLIRTRSGPQWPCLSPHPAPGPRMVVMRLCRLQQRNWFEIDCRPRKFRDWKTRFRVGRPAARAVWPIRRSTGAKWVTVPRSPSVPRRRGVRPIWPVRWNPGTPETMRAAASPMRALSIRLPYAELNESPRPANARRWPHSVQTGLTPTGYPQAGHRPRLRRSHRRA